MQTLEIINPLDHPEWDKLVLTSSGCSVFHTSFWARVLHDSYGYRPCYLARKCSDRLDVLVPMMEIQSLLTGKRGVSLPFTDYCEPIVQDENGWRDAMAYLKEYGKNAKWKYLEIRGGGDWFGQIPLFSHFYGHILKLQTDTDALYAQLKSSTKRNIGKATREGVTVVRSNTLDAVRSYYTLHCLTRKKHGLPPQPYSFFQNIFKHIISRGHGEIGLAEFHGKIIAGALYLHFGNEATYKFGASDSKYLHLRPNDLLMWEAIQHYSRNGYGKFCFGRTEPDNAGLRQFKRGWGAEETVIRYYKYDMGNSEFITETASISSLSTRIIQMMPLPVSKLIGHMLYRHVG
jgi:hypothetical protein